MRVSDGLPIGAGTTFTAYANAMIVQMCDVIGMDVIFQLLQALVAFELVDVT